MISTLRNIISILILLFRLVLSGLPIALILYSIKNRFSVSTHQGNIKRIGKTLRLFLQNSGPTFIKLGQVLSTRPDLTGEIISEELSQLQDNLKSFPFALVEREILEHFGKPINTLFSDFNHTATAAASIAQVHKARTIQGDWVAVKVLRPNIEKRFSQDLKLFSAIVSIMEFISGARIKRLKLQDILSMLSDIVQYELDLRYEGASADQIRENCKNDEGLYIPKVHWNLTSKRILVTDWINAISINDKDAILNAGLDLHQIAKNLAVTFFNQAYRDGFFHADLHPGNIFVNEKGEIALVDFGIVGSLSRADRVYIAEILYGFINRDYKRVADIHFEAGYVPKSQNRLAFALACRSIGEPIIGRPVNEISIAHLLKQLLEVTKQFQMETQPQLLLLQKTMVTIEGVGYKIYPEVNMWQLAEPWIKTWAQENFGLKSKVTHLYESGLELTHTLPNLLNGLECALNKYNAHEPRQTEKQYSYTKQIITSVLIGAAFGALGSLWFLG